MSLKIWLGTALAILPVTSAFAVDCFKETGTYNGDGSQYSNVDSSEYYSVAVELGANSYSYTRTYAAGLQETGTFEFKCHDNGFMEWVNMQESKGAWDANGNYELGARGTNYSSNLSMSLQNGRLYLIIRNAFDDGVIVRYGDLIQKDAL
jgi:hypothetical protein